jgi:hypothetical protein
MGTNLWETVRCTGEGETDTAGVAPVANPEEDVLLRAENNIKLAAYFL